LELLIPFWLGRADLCGVWPNFNHEVAAALILLLIGAYNADPSASEALPRNVGIESVLLMDVVGLAAVLANKPPVHH
jgi:putative copper export protein